MKRIIFTLIFLLFIITSVKATEKTYFIGITQKMGNIEILDYEDYGEYEYQGDKYSLTMIKFGEKDLNKGFGSFSLGNVKLKSSITGDEHNYLVAGVDFSLFNSFIYKHENVNNYDAYIGLLGDAFLNDKIANDRVSIGLKAGLMFFFEKIDLDIGYEFKLYGYEEFKGWYISLNYNLY